jgi:hypothetical protein
MGMGKLRRLALVTVSASAYKGFRWGFTLFLGADSTVERGSILPRGVGRTNYTANVGRTR